MAKLFKNNIISEKLQNFIIPDFEEKISILKSWENLYKTQKLHNKKEEELEGPFGDDVFGKILGYASLSENEIYNRKFQPKVKEGGQKADLGLGFFASEKEIMKVVIELKDSKTSLDKPQQRAGNLTPVQQAFKYKPYFKECDFVIVSNFYETRLYIDSYYDFEVWTLTDLVNEKDNYYNFRVFYYLLCKENLIKEQGDSNTKSLLSIIRTQEKEITKKFYSEYSDLRKELFKDIIKHNSFKKSQLDLALNKTQKIIDRIIFIHFCEDLGLLPDGKLREVIDYGEKSLSSVWDTLKNFFKAVDKGSEKLGIPDGYNGGLFHEDKDLDKLKVGDDICKAFVDLGDYDFKDDLSVNILGHIFEQSISDIEEIKNKINFDEEEITVSKRKKDGIFYTPEYIVDYIVKNSVGKKIDEWEENLKEKHNLKEEITDKNYEKRAIIVYSELQEKVQNIKVLDPACGSGAFLVKVFDFLLEKNKEIAKKLEDLGNTQGLFSTESHFKNILQNNIYGVDLNEESVEITKLSLWLRTASKGKKLANLDSNIKCGNSLIDDESVAGEKAFKWEKEFSEIFVNGGFDVVVGNPPYGATFDKYSRKYFIENYKTAFYKLDTYALFIEKSLKLLKKSGINGFIVPYTWLSIGQHKKLRELVLKYKINKIIDLPLKIFESADLDTIIFIISKIENIKNNIKVYNIQGEDFVLKGELNIKEILLKDDLLINLQITKEDGHILNKILKNTVKIDDICKISQGLIPYDKYRGHTEEQIKNRVFHSDKFSLEFSKKEIRGEDVSRYNLNPNNNLYINYGKHLAAPRDQDFFTKERLLIREITRGNYYKIYSTYTDNEYYNTPVMINIISKNNDFCLKYILTLLNSKLYTYYHLRTHSKALAETSIPKILVGEVRNIPIKNIPLSQQQPFIEKADFMLTKNKELQEKLNSSLEFLKTRFNLEKVNTKLEKFYELDFIEFKKTLNIKKISISDEEDLMNWLKTKKQDLMSLKTQIDECDKEIDNMVFDLYGLDKEERKVVLGSN